MWAQWLAGLQFLSDDVKNGISLSASHMQNTIQLLRHRIKARLSLLKQLVSLGKYTFKSWFTFLSEIKKEGTQKYVDLSI